MEKLLTWIDRTAGIDDRDSRLVVWLERASFIFLILMTVSAPHSIAATQTAWITGMLLWVIRAFLRPRPKFRPDYLDYALWAFFVWSVISAVFSYAPDISIDKLRVVALFLIVYFVYHNIRTIRAAKFLAGALVVSSMVAVIWTPLERIPGRGVQVFEFQGGPFEQIGLDEGDTILEVNGQKVSSLAEVRDRIGSDAKSFRAKVYHSDSYVSVEIPSERLIPATTAEESLSVKHWRKGRAWRAAGFFGHYTTFAEVLQLIMSLAFGIFSSLASERFLRRRTDESSGFFSIPVLGVCLSAMALAMIMTVTRASQLALMVSAAAIVLLLGNRRLSLTLAAVALPLALVGLMVLQQTRGVGFLDANDNSTTWRQTVYREGFDLWTSNARNFTLGVGMDSIKRYSAEWHLFDNGRLPVGHFHSTPLQIAVERGLPGLLLWLTIIAIYLRRLYCFKSDEPIARGIILGIFGGAIGFLVSGTVHYNLGDSEVAMVFFFLMGLGLALINQIQQNIEMRNS
jgi:hypothetical protein